MSSELLTFLRQSLDNREYRAIAVVGILGVLVGAAIGFAARPRWEMAVVGALLALPGGLVGGVLHVALERAKRQMYPQTTSTACRKGLKTPLAGALVLLVVIAMLLALIVFWDAIPGTYYRDGSGFPHGTGQAEYTYDDGSLMLREWYFRGLIYRSTWFKPDGTEIATETYDKNAGGIGYYLRQDGSIRCRCVYEYSPEDNLYIAAGSPVYYDRDGRPVPDATEPIE